MSSTVDSLRQVYAAMRGQYGKLALNALFPNEFEAYMMGLELVNSSGEVEDYFVFPINPSNIAEVNRSLDSIRKTLGGVSIHSTEKFVPTDISLQGSFGRKLKFLVGDDLINFAGLSFGFKKGRFKFDANSPTTTRELSSQIKTGYGCFKVLESICHRSNHLDENGKPYELYFYNLALGNSYLVRFMELTPNMSEATNMIWNYSLQLKSIAPIHEVRRNSGLNLVRALGANFVQGKVNQQLSSLTRILS